MRRRGDDARPQSPRAGFRSGAPSAAPAPSSAIAMSRAPAIR